MKFIEKCTNIYNIKLDSLDTLLNILIVYLSDIVDANIFFYTLGQS